MTITTATDTVTPTISGISAKR